MPEVGQSDLIPIDVGMRFFLVAVTFGLRLSVVVSFSSLTTLYKNMYKDKSWPPEINQRVHNENEA